MSRRLTVTTGFVLVDAAGRTIDHFACPVDACHAMNKVHDRAESVRRVEDGVLIATKHRVAGESFWAPLWRQVFSGAIT